MTTIQLELEPFSIPGIAPGSPVIIAGPCSAETEEQVLETAISLSSLGVRVFRAGIWKPRTRPNSFEGVGSKGLRWLERVRKETGMLTAIEVANVKHVYSALRYNIDILWIGARTTANPFAMQEIADALEGTEVPVMVKNPVNPDIELWIGALERLNQAGIKKLAAIHRGFSYYHPAGYRNDPQWQIPIDLRRRIPELPIITDPSHICGNRTLLYEVSQRAMDLHFDGLIIEVHPDPEKALSDRDQQLNPADFEGLIKRLKTREEQSQDVEYLTELQELRREIDKYDQELISLFAKRMNVSVRIGQCKKRQNVAILQTGRWTQILEKVVRQGGNLGLSEDFVTRVFKAVHQESINVQNRVMNP